MGPRQLSTTWLAFGCSLLVHAGGIWTFAYLSKLSGPIYLPRLQYAHGETPVTVTVRFLSEAQEPAGQNLTQATVLTDTALPGIGPDTSEHITLADAVVTTRWGEHHPADASIDEAAPQEITPSPRSRQIGSSSADQPNSQAIRESQIGATQSSSYDNTGLGTDSGADQVEVFQTALYKPIKVAVISSDSRETASEEGIEKRAQVLNLPRPKYPLQSRRRGEEGLVLLEVEVLPRGIAGVIRVLKDPGYPRLIDAAIAAVRAAKFEPAMRNGHHIRTVIKVPFEFDLR